MLRGSIYKMAEQVKLCIPLHGSIHNKFEIVKRDVRTGKVIEKAFAYNLLTDYFWTRFDEGSWFNYIRYGTGVAAPNVSDIALGIPLGSGIASNETFNIDELGESISVRREFEIPSGSHVGEELSEVGLSYSHHQGDYLSTHALLKDMNDNLITIVIGEYDVITIYATVYFKYEMTSGYLGGRFNLTPFHTSLFMRWILGLDYDINTALGNVDTFRAPAIRLYNIKPALDSTVGGMPYTKPKADDTDYRANIVWNATSKQAVISYPRIQPADGNNADGIGLMAVGLMSQYPDNLNPRFSSWAMLGFPNSQIPYTEISGEDIGVGSGALADFKTKFGLINNDSFLHIYVDVEYISA